MWFAPGGLCAAQPLSRPGHSPILRPRSTHDLSHAFLGQRRWMMRRRSFSCATAGLALLSLLGCSEPLTMDDVLGDWETESVSGVSLPGTIPYANLLGGTDSMRLEAAQWSFLEGGWCSETAHVDGEVRTIGHADCRFRVDFQAESIFVRLYDFGELPGTVSRSAITLLADDQYEWVLRRSPSP